MFQQRQPLRQISVMKMEKLSFEENTQRMTMKIDVLTYMNMLLRQNAKNIVTAFIHCTVIQGYTQIHRDLHRYALVHFQIDVNYKYTATPHENCKKPCKPYLKAMSSTIESLKISASSKKPKLEYIDIMGKVGKTTSLSELPKNYNQAYYASNFVKNKFESILNTGDDLLQAVYKCKKKVGRSS